MAKHPYYDGPVTKHQHLAIGGNPYAEYEDRETQNAAIAGSSRHGFDDSGRTGGLRHESDDTERSHGWNGGSSNIHTTDPSKDAGNSHGTHGHTSVESHYESQKGGHRDMHSNWPEGNSGGHRKGSNY